MGVEGIYHVCRLREGTDTELRPEDRIATMRHAKEAGLKVFTCCEPIGPEHTVDELVDSVFLAIDLGLELVRLLIGEMEAQTVKERIQPVRRWRTWARSARSAWPTLWRVSRWRSVTSATRL